jgi:hypothetical protein
MLRAYQEQIRYRCSRISPYLIPGSLPRIARRTEKARKAGINRNKTKRMAVYIAEELKNETSKDASDTWVNAFKRHHAPGSSCR